MKKYFILIVFLLLILFALCGCNSQDNNANMKVRYQPVIYPRSNGGMFVVLIPIFEKEEIKWNQKEK